jgi:fructokinase
VDSALRIGIDLGGTKTEGVVVRLAAAPGQAPEVLARTREPTRREEGYDHVVGTVTGVVHELVRQAGLAAPPPLGVGMPGGVSRLTGEELVKNSNTTCLNGRPFRRDLRAALGAGVTVEFANDANCFALAEAAFGAARGAEVAFGVILGTGVGGGVVLPGERGPRAWDGAQGIAGEWGHVVLDPVAGPPCYCGKRGCVETYLSGPAIEAAYARRAGAHRPLAEIAARRAPDGAAAEVLAEVADLFGRALATVVDVLDPDVVVLGGGVSNLELFYDEGVAAVARWVFNDELRTRIVKNALGDSAGVLGAALLPRV